VAPAANGAAPQEARPAYTALLLGLLALALVVAVGLGTYFALKPSGSSTPSSAIAPATSVATASSPTAATLRPSPTKPSPTPAVTLGPAATCQRLIPLLREAAGITLTYAQGKPIDADRAHQIGSELSRLADIAPTEWWSDIMSQADMIYIVGNDGGWDNAGFTSTGTRLVEGCRPYAR
jgi:hypothetical protein